MLQAINTWADYRTQVREFDAVLEHGKAVSSVLAAVDGASPRASYGGRIYAKVVAHGVALRKLAADTNLPMPLEPWDVPSMSAMARCLIEAHDAYEYIAGHLVSDDERGFRIRLWELHDATRRLKLLQDMGPEDANVASLRADAHRLQTALEAHPVLAALPAPLQEELRRRFVSGDPPAFHLGQRKRCKLSGVDPDWHAAITQQLSQHAHTLPYSLQQPLQFRPGTPDALRLMALPLTFALPFLARATHAVARLMPGATPEPPSRTGRTMVAWRSMADQRPKAEA